MTLVHLSSVVLMLLQTPATGNAVLQGRVVRAGSETAVPYARIVAAKVGGQLTDYHTAEADASGRFSLRNLTPGSYRIYAQRDGYLQTEFGRRPAGTTGVPVVLAEGQTSPTIVIEMIPPGVIAGQVLDEGRPARNVWVRALKPTYFDGQLSLRIVEYARTDDRGEYRLFDLPPGFYFVSALPPERPRIQGNTLATPAIPSNANDNRTLLTVPLTAETLDSRALMRDVYAAVYHPGTTDVTLAMPIEVQPGSVRAGITLAIARTPTFRVRGRVSFSDAASDSRVRVGVVQRQEGTAAPIREVDAVKGSFEIAGVPPGRYVLWAQTVTEPGAARRRAVQAIEILDRNVDDITVTLEPNITVRGRVSIDGAPPAQSDGQTLVQLQPATPGQLGLSALRIQPDGTFAIENVAPGDYRFRVLQPQRIPWIKEARFGGVDVTTAPIRIESTSLNRELEIVLGTKTAAIDVRVLDRNQRPVAGALVVAVPDEARRNRSSNFRTGTTDADGRVRIDQIAPGEYRVFASIDIEAAAWQDPNVLRLQQARGEVVRLLEGGAANLVLRITP